VKHRALNPILPRSGSSLSDPRQKAVDEPCGVFGAQEPGSFHCLSDRYAIRDLFVEQNLPQTNAQNRTVNDGHSRKGPALRIRFDQLINLIAVLGDSDHDFAGIAPGRRSLRVCVGACLFDRQSGIDRLLAHVGAIEEVECSLTSFGACTHEKPAAYSLTRPM